MRDRFQGSPLWRWLAAVLIAGTLCVALSGSALAAEESSGHEEGSNNLPAGAWVGLAISFALGSLLLAGSATYILPKPTKR